MSSWFPEFRDRVVASDPGLARLRMASHAAFAMGTALGVAAAFGQLTGAGPQATLIAMLLGAIVAMMGSMALASLSAPVKILVAAFFPVAMGVGLVAGIAVGGRTDLTLGVFVVVMFVAVFVRRFGPVFFFFGFMSWMGYFFAAFLRATWAQLPSLLLATAVASAWVLLLSLTVLRVNRARTLTRIVRAFGARARAVPRAAVDLLEAEPAARPRIRRRLRRRQAQLAEAALMVEAWSAEPRALPPGWSAPALRRRLLDAHQTVDDLAAAADALVGASLPMTVAAVAVLDALAHHDDRGARAAARELAESVDAGPDESLHPAQDGSLDPAQDESLDPGQDESLDPGQDESVGQAVDGSVGPRPTRTEVDAARQLAAAAAEFVRLAGVAELPPVATDDGLVGGEFDPVVSLAMGSLPGSPAVAGEVAARGGRWNPVARGGLVTRQAVQVALAGALAIGIGRELSPTRYYWAVIAAFVMFTGTATRAETFLKAVNRVVGTLVGLFASIWVANLTAGNTLLVLATIIASMFFGFYLVQLNYGYMIFFVTIMVGQLYSVLHEFSDDLLTLRLAETAVGAAAGFAVALLVAPLSTRDTVRSVRNALFTDLAALLDEVAAGLDTASPVSVDLDRLARGLDDRARQLALVARPLTRPIVFGNSSPRMRHRLVLYAAVVSHARSLSITVRREPRQQPTAATAARSLATAARALAGAGPGVVQPVARPPLDAADAALLTALGEGAGADAFDPVTRPLVHLSRALRELAGLDRPLPSTVDEPAGAVTAARV